MTKQLQLIAIIVVLSLLSQAITGKSAKQAKKPAKKPNMETVGEDDPEVKEAMKLAFPSDTLGDGQMEFIEAKRNNSDTVSYQIKVKLIQSFECDEDNNPENNQYVTKTDDGCQTNNICTAHVAKLSDTDSDKEHKFRTDGIQCIA